MSCHQFLTVSSENDVEYIYRVLKQAFSYFGWNPVVELTRVVPKSVLINAGRLLVCYAYIWMNLQLQLVLLISLTMHSFARGELIPNVETNYGNIPLVFGMKLNVLYCTL